MKNQDYLMHYGVQGMRWGFRKRIPRSSGSVRTTKPSDPQAIAREKARNRARKKAYKVSKSAARSYYKKDRTDSFQDYQKYDKQQNRKEARLTQDQVAEGRHRVARARNIKRKAVSIAVGSAAAVGLASVGAVAAAPILGMSLAALTNGVSGGMYYAKQSRLYGKQRNRLQKALAD